MRRGAISGEEAGKRLMRDVEVLLCIDDGGKSSGGSQADQCGRGLHGDKVARRILYQRVKTGNECRKARCQRWTHTFLYTDAHGGTKGRVLLE